jgi:hypothetical protein
MNRACVLSVFWGGIVGVAVSGFGSVPAQSTSPKKSSSKTEPLPAIKTAPAKAPTAPQSAPAQAGPFHTLVANLSGLAGEKPLSVGVGNFTFENTELLSPFAALLRDELEASLARTPNFRVVSRDRLADLQNEGKFQARDFLEPGTGVSKVSVEGIEGIVRGRFYAASDRISVFVELVRLEGATIQKFKTELPSSGIRARIWPDTVKPANVLESVVRPQNVDASAANVEEVTRGRIKQVSRDFPLEIFTVDTRRAFTEGEVVAFRVRSDRDCHVAVFCHQSDGSSVLLFPNHWQRDAFVPAARAVDIPGTHKHGFEIRIGEPFGSDVVQAVACTSEKELQALTAPHMRLATATSPFAVITRGMAAVGIEQAAGSGPVGENRPLWSESHLVVSTFPKMP